MCGPTDITVKLLFPLDVSINEQGTGHKLQGRGGGGL